ncbi:MAG: hypothetical protein GF310_01180 [candidate division Zixibacteria bacterium]|nr:hypothetical protein [candidate division Zixibacteria bacterium]
MLNEYLIINFFSTVFLTGLIWIIQVVHYPLIQMVDEGIFVSYMAQHRRKISYLVLPLMLIELASAIMLALNSVKSVIAVQAWIGLILVIVIWLSTFMAQVPLHKILAAKKDTAAINRLVKTNWVRTFLWSARALLLLWMIISLLYNN